MAIIRIHANEQYTAMSRHHLRDTSLSWQAMGMLSFMLSCNDTFKFSIEGLTMCSGSGETATRTALKELKDKGYVVVSRALDEYGKVTEWCYDIYEKPDGQNPVVENPHVENPVVANQGQRIINKRITNESLSLFGDESPRKEYILSESKIDAKFERFWEIYGKKVQRAQAERMWKRLKESEKDEILRNVAHYVASTPDVQFRMNPATYVNPANARWRDEVIVKTEPKPQAEEDHVWRM